jgi:hypothetical protein
MQSKKSLHFNKDSREGTMSGEHSKSNEVRASGSYQQIAAIGDAVRGQNDRPHQNTSMQIINAAQVNKSARDFKKTNPADRAQAGSNFVFGKESNLEGSSVIGENKSPSVLTTILNSQDLHNGSRLIVENSKQEDSTSH